MIETEKHWKTKKEKQKTRKTQTATINTFLLFYFFTFLYWKIYVLLDNIFGKNLVYIVKFVLQFFSKHKALSFVDTVLRFKILGNRLGF